MNLTLAVDEATVERARDVARRQGTSLNGFVRNFIAELAGQTSGEALLAEFEALWAEPLGFDANDRFDRDAIYEERLARFDKGKRRS